MENSEDVRNLSKKNITSSITFKKHENKNANEPLLKTETIELK